MEQITNHESRLHPSSIRDSSGVSFGVEAWKKEPNAEVRHLLRWPLRKGRYVSSIFGVSALAPVISLAVVYLLLVCFGSLERGYNEWSSSRMLAEGGSSPPFPGCSGRGFLEDHDEGRQEEEGLRSMAPLRPTASVVFLTGEEAAALGWGARQVPSDTHALLKKMLTKLERTALKCKNLVSKIPGEQGLMVLREVARVAAVELACVSLVPLELEPNRQRVVAVYLETLKDASNASSSFSDPWFSEQMERLVLLFEGLRKTRPLGQACPLKYMKLMRSAPALSNVANVHVDESLDRLLSASQYASQLHWNELFRWELYMLDELRKCRVRQVLRAPAVGNWLIGRQRHSGAWIIFSPEELGNARREPKLPSFKAQAEEIRETARRAGGGGRFSSVEVREPVREQSVEQENVECSVGEGAALAEGPTLPHRLSLQHEAPQQIRKGPCERGEGLRCVKTVTEDLFWGSFGLLEQSARATRSLKNKLDSIGAVELVRRVAALGVLELGACPACPASLEHRRQMATQQFVELLTEALQVSLKSGMWSLLRPIQNMREILLRMTSQAQLNVCLCQDVFNDAVFTQASASLRTAQHMFFILQRLAHRAEGVSSGFTALMLQKELNTLDHLASLRVRQISRSSVLCGRLLRAQSQMKTVVFAFDETQARSGYSVARTLEEIDSLIDALRGHTKVLSQTNVTSGTPRAVGAADLDEHLEIVAPSEGWQTETAVLLDSGPSVVAQSRVYSGVWRGDKGVLGTSFPHMEMLYQQRREETPSISPAVRSQVYSGVWEGAGAASANTQQLQTANASWKQHGDASKDEYQTAIQQWNYSGEGKRAGHVFGRGARQVRTPDGKGTALTGGGIDSASSAVVGGQAYSGLQEGFGRDLGAALTQEYVSDGHLVTARVVDTGQGYSQAGAELTADAALNNEMEQLLSQIMEMSLTYGVGKDKV